jgi:hypothetical protein
MQLLPLLLHVPALGIPAVSVFLGQYRFYGFKELCLSVLKNSVQDPKCPGFSKSQKQSIFEKAHEYFDFPKVLKNTYRSNRVFNQQLTGSSRRGTKRCTDW